MSGFRNVSVRVWIISPLEPSGHFTYRQFNVQIVYILPTQCIYVFCMDLRKKNSDYFSIKL